MRASIKHAMKRGDKLDAIKKNCFGVSTNDPKKLVKL